MTKLTIKNLHILIAVAVVIAICAVTHTSELVGVGCFAIGGATVIFSALTSQRAKTIKIPRAGSYRIVLTAKERKR